MALKSLVNNKVRSLLTMLGIIIGVASVIAIVASIQGLSRVSELQFEAMGTNIINIGGGGGKKDDWNEFEEYLESDARVDAWTPVVGYSGGSDATLRYRSKTLPQDTSYTQMYFANQNYGYVSNHIISSGRDISESDCKKRARVCVIGETLRRYFFGAMSPIGQKLRIGSKNFEIIGVYKGKYGGKLNTEDQMLVMPYPLSTLMIPYSTNSREYLVRAVNKDDIEPLTEDINVMMSAKFADRGYFFASSNTEWQAQSQSSNNTMAMVGGGIAGISLLVGGIGIMNIMLVSVTERTREIGIRMAIGARKRDIISQFLVESAVVSCCGGILGIILGGFMSAVIGDVLVTKSITENPWMPQVEEFTVLPPWWLILGAFLFSALLGIVFGLYPANKASNLQPVDALRTQ